MLLHLNIGFEDLFFGIETNSSSVGLSGFLEIVASQAEIGVEDPQFAKSKSFMGNQSYGLSVNSFCFGEILSDFFLKESIVIPYVHVSSPKAFFLSWRFLLNSCLVNFSDPVDLFGCFFQEDQVEPGIIVQRVLGDLVFVEISPLSQDNLVNLFLGTVLLLEAYVHFIEFFGLFLRNVPQAKLEDLSSSLILSLLDFEFSKLNEIILLQGIYTQLSNDSLKYMSGSFFVSVSELKLGNFDIGIKMRVRLQILIQNSFGIFWFSHSFLKFNEGHPSFFSRTPFHPPCEYIASFGIFPNQLLHIGIFEPKLILPGEVVNGSFPYITGMIHKFVLHLHLSILQPQTLVRVINLQSSLKN